MSVFSNSNTMSSDDFTKAWSSATQRIRDVAAAQRQQQKAKQAQQAAPKPSKTYTVTTTKGKQYTFDDDAYNWISNRYFRDNADSYGLDDADQYAKRTGQMSASMRKSYKNSTVDQKLAQMGLPSEKNLEKYLGQYQQWHTGGIGQVFGNSVSAEQWTKMGSMFKQDWQYENTVEDQDRKRRGLMPSALEKNYTDTEIDDQLKASGLPSLKDVEKYNGQYWNYKGIDSLYSNVAREWANLRMNGIKNDGNDYPSADKLTEKPGTQWYADAFFNELNRKDENGEDVYGSIKGLFKNRTTTTTDPDPGKDYVTELGKMVLGANKADALEEDYAKYNAFSYDDFANHYDEYYDRDVKLLKVQDGRSVEEAMNAVLKHEDEDAEKKFYTVPSKKDVEDFIFRYNADFPDAVPEKMFSDMYAHGLSDKIVNQAKKTLQDQPGADKKAISKAYTAAKVSSGEWQKQQEALWDTINADPRDVPIGENEEKETNVKRVQAGTKSLRSYIDNAIKEGADAETVQLATDAIEKAINTYMDPDEGTISPDDVINILNGISEQPWNNATAMRLALEDYGFGENGELSGPAADLTAGWDSRDIRKVVNSIGSVRYNGIELSEEMLERLNNSMNTEISDDEAFYSRGANGQLDYERAMHAIDWANEQIQAGANEFDVYNILAAEGFQDEMEAYMKEDWHKALFAHERVKEAYEAAGGDQLSWYEGLTDEERYQHGLEIWNQLPEEEKEKMFQGYDWKFDPAVYRTGGQAWAQQFAAIIPSLAANLISAPVKFADMLTANITGREELWGVTKDLASVENKLASYGAVNDSLGNSAQLASIAADATQEVARMYALGSIGGAIGHGTKLGQALAETAGNEATKWGIKKIAGLGLSMMTSSPFVVNAAAGNYAEAKIMGASTGEATAYGLLTGTLEGVLESLNFDELWGKVLGEGAFGKAIMDGGAAFKNMGVVAKARIANMVASGLGEFSEETVSYLAETFWKTHASWGGDTQWSLEDWIQQAGMGFLTGMLGSGLSTGNITKDSILYEYWKSNPETRSAMLNTEVGRMIWEQASDTQKTAWRNGDTKVLSLDAFADLVTQMSILDNTPAKALDNYNRIIANINKKAENARAEAAAKFSKNSVERDGASAAKAATAYVNMTAEDALAAAARYEAKVTYENTVNNARAQLQVLQRQFSEHYAALYLQNETNIATRNVNGITANVSRDIQNGATVTPESRAEASGPVGVLQDNEGTSDTAEPTVASIREAAYNRVYKDQEIGKNAAGEASGSDANGLTRVEFADSERNNFQAKTTAKLRRVTLELAGLEAKEGMSAKEIFAEAKKAMTPEAAQKLDVYTRISKALGLDMVIRDVVAGTSGYVQDGKLYVTLNGKQNLLRVTAHELTHYMKDHVRGGYDNLRTHLISEVGGQGAFDQMVSEKAGEYGYDLNTEDGRAAADDEVCAELCEKMLENKDALARFVDKDMSAAQKFKARLGRTLVAIKSAIRSLGTSNTETRGDLIKEQDTIELWYKTLSDAIDSANAQGKAKTAPAAETAAETTATTGEAAPQAPPAPETNADLFISEESARREQLRSELEKLAERGTRVNGMQYQDVNDILDRAIFGDRSNYNKADYAQIRGMLAQLIPEVQAMVNEDANVDLDTLNERVSTAIDYMLSRYHEGSEDLYNLRELIPNKIALSETAYNDLRAKDMTLKQASRDLSSALGKFVSFVYKKSPDYNAAATIDEVWRDIGYDPDGVGNIAEDANALIDYVKERSGQSAFDDLYRSQREDIVAAQVGEFLDAVQEMVSSKVQANTVRFELDDTGLTEDQYNRVVDYVDNAIAGAGNNKAPYIQFGAVNSELVDGLHKFGVDIKEGTPHRLEDNYIRHLRQSHGIEKAKTWGINDSDVRAVPYIVNKYDRAYYRESPDGLKGILYAKDYVDTTYYVEGILEDGSLSGRQMIKVPLHEVPAIYKNDVQKEKALIALPDGISSPKSYVQDVTRDRASINNMHQDDSVVNPPALNSLDDDYMPLAERYDAGIATEEDMAEMQRAVDEAAEAAGVPSANYAPVIYDDDGDIIPLSERFNPNETDIRNMLDDDWDALIQQYGAKPQGREPRARDVQVPNRASDKLRVSDFTRSLDESSKVNDELSQEIHSEIASEAEELKKRWAYIQKSNDETMRSARDYIAQKQPTEAKQEFHDMVVAGQYSLKAEAIGLQLLADAAERNDWQAVKELAIDLRVLATDAGQRTQLFNILKDLKGVGSAWYIESLVKKLNNWYADDIRTGRIDGPITVSEEAMNQVRAAKTQAEVDAAEAVVAKEIAPQLPLELSDKLSNWRYLSMLGNPVTHIRNVTGNTLMAGMSSIKDVVAAGVQRIVEKTGLANESDRSHALLSDADKARWENFAEQSYEEQRKNLQGGGKLGFQSTLQQNKRSFDNKYLDAIARGADPGTMSEKKGLAGLIENIRNNGAMGMLEVEDAWGLRRAYKKALMERMVAQGYTLNGDGQVGKVGADGSFTEISQEDMNKAIEWATNQAWTATFRGPSQFASMLNKISKMNTASKLIVEGVMPFKKTPINIAKTGAMYSPAGVIIGTTQLLTKVKQGKMSAAQAVDNLASGLTGTALLALGAMLAKAGILRAGGEDKKRYETYLEDTGDQAFSLKFGDYSIDLSAIAPATIPLFMGVALQEALGKNGGDDDDGGLDLSTIVDVAAGALNPFMEMSFMSSLNSALKNYNNDGIGGALGNTILTAAQNYGSQYLPTIGGKVAQFVDPTRRTTKSDATSPIGGNLDYYVRSLAKKVPGLEATLQPDVDIWGRTDTKDSFGDWALDFANKFILPTNIKVVNRDSVDRELIRIVESTGNVDFLPSDGAKYFTVKGQKYTMNARQYTQYSQERGQAAYAALKDVMASPAYQAASDEEKYAMLKKGIDAAYKQVNTMWKDKLGAFDN